MRMLLAFAAAVVLATLQQVHGSGCFGGQPDVVPRNGSANVPSNGRVTISRRVPARVSWTGPDQRRIAFHERRAGSGPSSGLVLISDSPLAPGLHTIQTTDPDVIHTFSVVSATDSLPPSLTGPLTLEAVHAPDSSSECPDTTYIRASVPAPPDDRTKTEDLTYFVWLGPVDFQATRAPDIILPAESVSDSGVLFRFGEVDCGCIPRIKLEPGRHYRVTVRAVDTAGNVSVNALSANVTVPAAAAPRGSTRTP